MEQELPDVFLIYYKILKFDERVEMLIVEIESKLIGTHDDELNKKEKAEVKEAKLKDA